MVLHPDMRSSSWRLRLQVSTSGKRSIASSVRGPRLLSALVQTFAASGGLSGIGHKLNCNCRRTWSRQALAAYGDLVGAVAIANISGTIAGVIEESRP